jgi:hypothetical protein
MFSSLFQFVNQTTFKFYPHFLVVYGLALVIAIALHFYRKRTQSKLIKLKASTRSAQSWLTFFGLSGLFLLFCRYANVYILSMEFLHIANFLVTGTAIIYILVQLKKANSK